VERLERLETYASMQSKKYASLVASSRVGGRAASADELVDVDKVRLQVIKQQLAIGNIPLQQKLITKYKLRAPAEPGPRPEEQLVALSSIQYFSGAANEMEEPPPASEQ
jgi:hypothetical protein